MRNVKEQLHRSGEEVGERRSATVAVGEQRTRRTVRNTQFGGTVVRTNTGATLNDRRSFEQFDEVG